MRSLSYTPLIFECKHRYFHFRKITVCVNNILFDQYVDHFPEAFITHYVCWTPIFGQTELPWCLQTLCVLYGYADVRDRVAFVDAEDSHQHCQVHKLHTVLCENSCNWHLQTHHRMLIPEVLDLRSIDRTCIFKIPNRNFLKSQSFVQDYNLINFVGRIVIYNETFLLAKTVCIQVSDSHLFLTMCRKKLQILDPEWWHHCFSHLEAPSLSA